MSAAHWRRTPKTAPALRRILWFDSNASFISFKTFRAGNCPIVSVLRFVFYRFYPFLDAFLCLASKSRTPKVQLFLYLANYDCTFFNFHTCYGSCRGCLCGVFRPKNTKIFKHSEHPGVIFYVFSGFCAGFFISHPLFSGFSKPEIREKGFFPHGFQALPEKAKKTFFCNLLFRASKPLSYPSPPAHTAFPRTAHGPANPIIYMRVAAAGAPTVPPQSRQETTNLKPHACHSAADAGKADMQLTLLSIIRQPKPNNRLKTFKALTFPANLRANGGSNIFLQSRGLCLRRTGYGSPKAQKQAAAAARRAQNRSHATVCGQVSRAKADF